MQQTGGQAIALPTPLQATSNTDCHPHWCTATNHHTTRLEHTYHARTGFVQHDSHTMCVLMKHAKIPMNFEHYTTPMVHPVTGCTILRWHRHGKPCLARILEELPKAATRQGRKAQTLCLSWRMMKSGMHLQLQWKLFSLTQIQSSTTALKRMTPSAFGSQLGAT